MQARTTCPAQRARERRGRAAATGCRCTFRSDLYIPKAVASFVTGQRWISEAEPELGLGTVRVVDGRQVEIEFPAAGERRRYVAHAAPLRRVRFRIGDRVRDAAERCFTVEAVEEREGLLHYRGDGQVAVETDLAAVLSPSLPLERLLSGRVDPPALFDLRRETLERRSALRRSPARGLAGARVALLPHQIGIAEEVASRQAPRVLLADEVGLGKTIEAGLVLHRLLSSGRAARVLVLVPPSLVHQWLVEMLRRFHLWLRVFDEERCAAIEAATPEANPFLDEQLVLAGLDLFADERRAQQVRAAPWDVLIVDEAHRLGGGSAAGSEALEPGLAPARDGRDHHDLVAALAARTRAVLLLTATPEQLGRDAHFTRLQLLDPQRFSSRADFEREADTYEQVADFVDRLLDGGALRAADRSTPLLAEPSGHLLARFDAAIAGEPGARQRLVDDLVDRHGPGRVMFRNTRLVIGGFPARRPRLVSLPWSGGPVDVPPIDYGADPRVPWLRELLRELGDEKVLLICRTRAQVEAITAALARLVNLPLAVFHEQLTLLQRDRNAAYFAEPEGARMLLCSEIGSEGRNFQFAHHLVLFDLPEDLEVLEQRIGRLDRIGQTRDVEVHVPVLAGSSLEVRARWLHEGLNAFAESLRGAHELGRRFGARVAELAASADAGSFDAEGLDRLIDESATARAEVAARLQRGRDRLLERSSFRPARAASLIEEIESLDADRALEDLLVRLLEQQGVEVDEIGPRTFRLEPHPNADQTLPGIPPDGLTATFSRERALAREDLSFLSFEHPVATAAIELLLGSEVGNASFAVLPDADERGLFLEACYVVECVAPARLAADRFLAPTPLRFVVDQHLALCDEPFAATSLRRASPEPVLGRPELTRRLLPQMLAALERAAEERRAALVTAARQQMEQRLGAELARLELLRATGGQVSDEEMALARAEITDLRTELDVARLRLDSLRLVWKGPLPE